MVSHRQMLVSFLNLFLAGFAIHTEDCVVIFSIRCHPQVNNACRTTAALFCQAESLSTCKYISTAPKIFNIPAAIMLERSDRANKGRNVSAFLLASAIFVGALLEKSGFPIVHNAQRQCQKYHFTYSTHFQITRFKVMLRSHTYERQSQKIAWKRVVKPLKAEVHTTTVREQHSHHKGRHQHVNATGGKGRVWIGDRRHPSVYVFANYHKTSLHIYTILDIRVNQEVQRHRFSGGLLRLASTWFNWIIRQPGAG